MNPHLMKQFNLSYDSLYDLKYKNNNVFGDKIGVFLDEMKKEALTWGYEFKLNEKSQKFKLYKLMNK